MVIMVTRDEIQSFLNEESIIELSPDEKRQELETWLEITMNETDESIEKILSDLVTYDI